MTTIKTAISMPEDLQQAVKEYAGDKPFSTTVCELLRLALAGGISEVIPGTTSGIPSPREMDDIRERLSTLEVWKASMEVIPTGSESVTLIIPTNDDIGIPEVIPRKPTVHEQVTLDVHEEGGIPEVIPVIPEPQTLLLDQVIAPLYTPDEGGVIPEVIPDQSLLHIPHEEIPAPGKDEKIQITSEIRHLIVNHLSILNNAGMNYSQIAKEAGVNKSLITFIKNGAQKSIKQGQYQALMAVTPTTS